MKAISDNLKLNDETRSVIRLASFPFLFALRTRIDAASVFFVVSRRFGEPVWIHGLLFRPLSLAEVLAGPAKLLLL